MDTPPSPTPVAHTTGSPMHSRRSAQVALAVFLAVLLGLLVFLFFVKFLNVGLPAGWLEPILGTAGT